MELVILYDAQCTVCVHCRRFVESCETLVRVRFVDCRSHAARTRYGAIPFLVHELVVVDDRGRWWAGPAAFVMTLWALAPTRTLAECLASPELAGLSGWLFGQISANRGRLGWILGLPACEDGACSVPHDRPAAAYR